MKPAPFEYHRVASRDEAASLLSELGEDAKILAGGQSLIPLLALRLTRFDHLVDVNQATDLAVIEVAESEVRMGATVRQSQVLRSQEVASALPLLPMASAQVGHFQIRNRGTIGGSIAHADPAAEYPAVAVALDAEIELYSAKGTRTVPASTFFRSTFETDSRSDELLSGVRFPRWGGSTGFAVEEGARRSGDFAIAGAVAAIQIDADDRVSRAAVALFGVGPTPARATGVESALLGRPTADLDDSAIREIGKAAGQGIEPPADVHASANYRKHLATVMAARAVSRALVAAKSGGSR